MAGRAGAAGALRHRVVIEAGTPARDAGGGQTDPWADPVALATVWARIEPLGGAERLRAMRLEHPVTHRITIRHRAGVGAGHRVRLGARVFNVRAAIDAGERHRVLELLCEEGVAT